jgi:hypothetical protein
VIRSYEDLLLYKSLVLLQQLPRQIVTEWNTKREDRDEMKVGDLVVMREALHLFKPILVLLQLLKPMRTMFPKSADGMIVIEIVIDLVGETAALDSEEMAADVNMMIEEGLVAEICTKTVLVMNTTADEWMKAWLDLRRERMIF